jgi:hypothetical protein
MLASLARWIEKAPPIRTAWISFPMRFVIWGVLSHVVLRSIFHMLRGARLDGKSRIARGPGQWQALQS